MTISSSSLHWWQRGVVYQIYPRSFMDSDNDGIGDLNGVIHKLDYLSMLGIDAIWFSPIYPSPMADFGYDVSDYCDIHPMFGNLAVFDRLVSETHQRGLKIIIDWVPNHTSDQHPWFLASRSSRNNPKRDWYIWRDPKAGGEPPNNWGSFFGGPAWTFDPASGQYYMHQFCKEQPELNWRDPDVRAAMLDTLRFWLKRGVDGFRMDVIGLIIKDRDLRDNPPDPDAPPHLPPNDLFNRQLHVYNWDQDEVHEIVRDIRGALDEFEDRCGIGELWGPLSRWVKYYGTHGEELQLPFNFRLMEVPWTASAMRRSEKIQDPQGINLGAERSRDVARTPMQWDASPNAGFSNVEPWLPISADYATRNVAAQLKDPASMLSLYRKLFSLRRSSPALSSGGYQPLEAGGANCYAYLRQVGDDKRFVILNFDDRTQQVNVYPGTGKILLSTHLDRQEKVSLGMLGLRSYEGVIIEV